MIECSRISDIFRSCLAENNEPLIVEGVIGKFGFSAIELEKYREEIVSILMNLPGDFMRSKGGGTSFLSACMDSDGYQWGEHRNVNELMCLGMAIGKVKYCLPREMWSILPGGMPYFMIDDMDIE